MKQFFLILLIFFWAFFLFFFEKNTISHPWVTHSWVLVSSGISTLSGKIQEISSRVQYILDDTEVQNTLSRITKNRPKYPQDDAVFMNREKLLPLQKDRSYYTEWTVETPGEDDRWARRIIEGKGWELYFTDNHYKSFTRVR
jgi:guanyl-specific ribonuclease Sa